MEKDQWYLLPVLRHGVVVCSSGHPGQPGGAQDQPVYFKQPSHFQMKHSSAPQRSAQSPPPNLSFWSAPQCETEGKDLWARAAELGEGVSPEGPPTPLGLARDWRGPSHSQLGLRQGHLLPLFSSRNQGLDARLPPTYFGCLGLAN